MRWQADESVVEPTVDLILFFLLRGSDHRTLSFYPGDTYLHATAILTFMNGTLVPHRHPHLHERYVGVGVTPPSSPSRTVRWCRVHATAILTFMNGTLASGACHHHYHQFYCSKATLLQGR